MQTRFLRFNVEDMQEYITVLFWKLTHILCLIRGNCYPKYSPSFKKRLGRIIIDTIWLSTHLFILQKLYFIFSNSRLWPWLGCQFPFKTFDCFIPIGGIACHVPVFIVYGPLIGKSDLHFHERNFSLYQNQVTASVSSKIFKCIQSKIFIITQ